jgi:putative membrane protein
MVHVVSDSLNDFMDSAVKHYSSLFRLPPYSKMVLLLALLCVTGGLLFALILSPAPDALILGVPLGAALFFSTLPSDYVISKVVLKHDVIYDIRRTAGLSIFSWGLWIFFIFLGVATSPFLGREWGVKLCLLGFSAVMIFRLTVLLSTSFASGKRLFIASIVTPILSYLLFAVTCTPAKFSSFLFVVFLIPALVISIASSVIFTYAISQVGVKMLGFSGLSIFKAFLLNWIANLNEPFEKILEELGESHDVEVNLIKFCSKKPKAIIVVPSVHPGPFKNVGSSLLPFSIKKSLENELQCTVCVPHGLLGHEFDLASQLQNEKMIKSTIENVHFKVSEDRASPFVTVSDGKATACCQIFGKIALISFTLAPKTTEDLPQELGLFVRQEAKKLELECCIIVNAHNSIDGTMSVDEALASLGKVAVSCLEKAVSLKRLPFEVGAATVFPKEFSLRDGMGQGGITVVVVKVGKQKTAYIVIDGNNMISGLREKILSTLNSVGVDEGEVLTTDTHSVNAIVLGERGYHPIGEVIDHERLIVYVREATTNALNNIEPVAAACRTITVSDVRVIGENLLGKLCLLIDKALKRAKAAAIPIFTTSGLLLMLILALV